MARLFDDAQTEYLYKEAAPITAYPFAMAGKFRVNDAVVSTLIWVGDKDDTDYFAALIAGADSKVMALSHRYGGASTQDARTSTEFELNTWHHAAGIWLNVSERHAYLNGGGKGSNIGEVGAMSGHDTVAIGYCIDQSPWAAMSGDIAEAAIWNLTDWGANDTERETNFEKILPSLAKGFSPLHFPLGLVAYWPLIRGLNDKVGGYNLTASGTIVSPHCRIILPQGAHY